MPTDAEFEAMSDAELAAHLREVNKPQPLIIGGYELPDMSDALAAMDKEWTAMIESPAYQEWLNQPWPDWL